MVTVKSLQSYWRRRAVRKLDDLPATKNEAVVRLGDGGSGEPAAKPRPKLKRMNVSKPAAKVMGKLKDGYVDTMLMFAGDGGAASKKGGGGGTMWDRRIPRERQASMKKGGDFERKVTLHLYSSVIATR